MAYNWLGMFTLKLYQSKTIFIKGNEIMSIENAGRHINFKFLNVCTMAEFDLKKYQTVINMAFLGQSVDEYLQKNQIVSYFCYS